MCLRLLQRLANLVTGRQRSLRCCLVGLGFGVQRLVQNLLGFADTLNGLIDAVLALRDLRVGILGLLGQFGAQLIGLTHQCIGLGVFLLAVGVA